MSQHTETLQTVNPRGALTGVALDELACLFLPPQRDTFGFARSPLTLDGLKLSFELARMAYTLDVEPWMRAGWTDFSIQVDNQLTTGLKAREEDSFSDRVSALVGNLRVKRSRMAMKEYNPLAKVTGALRQRKESDTIKAVIMARPAGGGKVMIAVGFMGTGARFYDWFSNLRLGTADGFHKGFYQLTQAFIKSEAQILFPDTAEALGLNRLTLQDILQEMQSEDSRFILWMAGHSQGAAVMQVYCDRLIRELHIPQRRIVGCGFASPTVAADNTVTDGAEYPLYHVLNADDLIPRMGSMKHFGLCLQYTPDVRFREAAYGWSQSESDRKARRDAGELILYMTDTPSFLLAFTALLTAVCEEKSDDTILGGAEWLLSIAPIDRAFSFAGKKAKETLHSMMAYMHKTYPEIAGREMDGDAVRFLTERCRPIVQSMPLKSLMSALFSRLYPPHSLFNSSGNGAYWHIVNECAQKLLPFVWRDDPGLPPRRQYAKRFYALADLPPAAVPAAPPVRRAPPRRRAIHVRRQAGKGPRI